MGMRENTTGKQNRVGVIDTVQNMLYNMIYLYGGYNVIT